MTYEIYRYIFIGGLIACGVFFAVAAVLFFTLNIPKVISDLTGRTARKAIENIRMQNEQSGDKSYQSSPTNLERGKLTDKISRSGRLVKRDATPFGTGVITEKISTARLDEGGGETEVLAPESEYGETSVLAPEYGETSVLAPEPEAETYGETAVLAPEPQATPFALLYEITFIHTAEVIGQEVAQ